MNNAKNRRSPMTSGERLMFLAGTLFCLVLITTSMMGGLFARYAATGAGSDSARVAGFDVDVTGPADVDIEYAVNNDTGIYTIIIDNKSEVAVAYSIRVNVPQKDNFDIKVALQKPGTTQKTELDTVNGTNLDFKEVGTVAPNDTENCDLEFSVLDWAKFTEQTNADSRTVELAFSVHIDVVQID